MSKRTQTSKGFTLLEVIIAMMVMLVIILISSVFFNYYFKNSSFLYNQTQTLDQARNSLRQLVLYLRSARTSQEGAYLLVIAEDQRIAFYSDINRNGQVDYVEYYLDGQVIYQRVIPPQGPTDNLYDPANAKIYQLSEFVVNDTRPIFYYYNSSYPADSEPLEPQSRLLNTRVIEVRVFTNSSPQTQSEYLLSTQVMLRNLKRN